MFFIVLFFFFNFFLFCFCFIYLFFVCLVLFCFFWGTHFGGSGGKSWDYGLADIKMPANCWWGIRCLCNLLEKLVSIFCILCQKPSSNVRGSLQLWVLMHLCRNPAPQQWVSVAGLVSSTVIQWYSLCGNWDWIKNLLSLVPKADITIVQLDLLGVAMVFFSFISCFQISLFLLISIDQLTRLSMLISIGFLAWLEHFVWVWFHLDPSVSPHGATG